jgi:hypothetical protein
MSFLFRFSRLAAKSFFLGPIIVTARQTLSSMLKTTIVLLALLVTLTSAGQTDAPLTRKRFQTEFLNRTWQADSTDQKEHHEDLFIATSGDSIAFIYLNLLESIDAGYGLYTYRLTGKWFELKINHFSDEKDDRKINYVYGYFTAEDKVMLCFPDTRIKPDETAFEAHIWFPFSVYNE